MSLLLRNKGAMVFLMINMFLAMSAFGLVVPVMPEYIRILGLNGTTAGLLTAAFAVTQFFSRRLLEGYQITSEGRSQ